jgi:hypothetical protein
MRWTRGNWGGKQVDDHSLPYRLSFPITMANTLASNCGKTRPGEIRDAVSGARIFSLVD